MCGIKYYGTILNQGYTIEDVNRRNDGKLGDAEREEEERANKIDVECKLREARERKNRH